MEATYYPYDAAAEKLLAEFALRNDVTLPQPIYAILENIAEYGVCCFDWAPVKKALHFAMDQRLAQVRAFEESQAASAGVAPAVVSPAEWAELVMHLHQLLDAFDGIPFTIQRICELVTRAQHYRAAHKLAFALEKSLCVTATIPRHDPQQPVTVREAPPPPPPPPSAAEWAAVMDGVPSHAVPMDTS